MQPVQVLLLLTHFLPGYKSGGPLQSVLNLVRTMEDRVSFRLLVTDRDLGDTDPYPGIATDVWLPYGKAKVMYCSPEQTRLFALARTIRETPHDLLYLNSFFAPTMTVRPLLARRLGLLGPQPVILSPRGEFSAGALALKSSKKQAYIRLGKSVGLFKNLMFQASTNHEAQDIHATLSPRPDRVRVACDLSAPLPAVPPPHVPRAAGAPLRVVFLSRISPMKNLAYAMEVLAQVNHPVVFTIYGPEEDVHYAAQCRALAKSLPPEIVVRWQGPLDPEQVPQALAAQDLFFLPTRGENFGHVIAESLGAGTPVLLSDTTPWRELAGAGVGYDLPLADRAAFAQAITAQAAFTQDQAVNQRLCTAAFARTRLRESADVQAHQLMFEAALQCV